MTFSLCNMMLFADVIMNISLCFVQSDNGFEIEIALSFSLFLLFENFTMGRKIQTILWLSLHNVWSLYEGELNLGLL